MIDEQKTAEVLKTTAAATFLQVPVHSLLNWVRYGVIERPEKDSSGHFLWTNDDVARARQVWEQRRPDRRDESAAG